MKAIRDIAYETFAAGSMAAGWVRYAVGFGLRCVGHILTLAAVPTALSCFWLALKAVHPDGFSHLALRYTDALGDTGMLHLVNVALWPAHYGYLIAFPAAGLRGHQQEALLYAGVGAALLVVANVVHLKRQTFENHTGKVAVILWWIAMILTAFDFLRCFLLPMAWDAASIIDGIPNGAALRAAEIVVSAYLWSLYLVTAQSRVDVAHTRAWAEVSMRVRRDITAAMAVFVAGLPFVTALVLRILGDTHKPDPMHLRLGLAIIFGAPLPLLVLIRVIDALKLLVSYRIAIMSDGDLLVPSQPEPTRPVRW